MSTWDRDPGNDQFAQAEAAGFNPYAGSNGRYETPPKVEPVQSFFPQEQPDEDEVEQQWQDIINRYDEE